MRQQNITPWLVSRIDATISAEHRLLIALLRILPHHLTAAVSPNGDGLMFWIAAAGDDNVAVPDCRAAGSGRRAGRGPKLLAGVRIVAGDLVEAADEKLIFAGHVSDLRRRKAGCYWVA